MSAQTFNELDSEIFHWELSEQYKYSMICPSQLGDEWIANFADWDGYLVVVNNGRVTYPTATDAIAAAKAEINQHNGAPDPDGAIFHWEMAIYYRGHLICPSLFEGGWFGNFFDWTGLVENLEEEFSSADDAIAVARPRIDREIMDWIKIQPVQGLRDLQKLGVIHVPESWS